MVKTGYLTVDLDVNASCVGFLVMRGGAAAVDAAVAQRHVVHRQITVHDTIANHCLCPVCVSRTL